METPINQLHEWTKSSVTLKFLSVGFLILLLLIPSSMITSLVQERRSRRNEAVMEITSSWAGQQILRGPLLSIPFHHITHLPNGTLQSSSEVAHFVPAQLDCTGSIDTEVRHRGIFKTVVYTTNITMKGEFVTPTSENFDANQIDWEKAAVSIGLSDLRGVKDSLEINWNGTTYTFTPGIKYHLTNDFGASTEVSLQEPRPKTIPFSMTVRLKGSESLSFVPLGKKSTVKLSSKWPTPSFTGSFLPDERQISAAGFDASWNVLYFNRNLPDQWNNDGPNLNELAFGVDLLFPVDHYSNVTRSTKYAVLFIFLTFLVFFFVEFFNKKRMHPIQYLLVGGALTLFYLLLLSLSEHIPFPAAYIIATLGVIGMISAYTHAVFERPRVTAGITAMLVGLYSFLYTLLQMEDYALLIGSVGLFAVLATIMYVTRKIDWYAA